MEFLSLWKKYLVISIFIFFCFFVLQTRAVNAGLVINEIMYDLEGGDDKHEWLELFNDGISGVDLTGWQLNDGDGATNHGLNAPPKNGGQGSTIIPVGNYVILADDAATFLADHSGFAGAVIDTVISLGQQKDRVYTLKILNKEGLVVNEISYSINLGANGNGKTLERKSDGSWQESSVSGGTPGQQNSSSGSLQTSPTPAPTPTVEPSSTPTPESTSASSDNPTPTPNLVVEGPAFVPSQTSTPVPEVFTPVPSPAAPSPTPMPQPTFVMIPVYTPTPKPVYSRQVVINEFLPDPIGDDGQSEWIELYNEGNEPVDLGGWSLTDKTSKHTIHLNTMIGARTYLVFSRTVTRLSINNSGETLSLFDPNGDLAFKITYEGKAEEGQSLNRQVSGKWSWSALPTSGQANIVQTSAPKPTPSAKPKMTESPRPTPKPTAAATKKPSSPSPTSQLQRSEVADHGLPAPASPTALSRIETSAPALNVSAAPIPAAGREETVGLAVGEGSDEILSPTASEERGAAIGGDQAAPAEQNDASDKSARSLSEKDLTASASGASNNFEIIGIAALLGIGAVAGILFLKKFLK